MGSPCVMIEIPMKSSDFWGSFSCSHAQVSRCGIDLHGKQCCAAYKKEVGITDGVNLLGSKGVNGSCGSRG